MKNKVLSIFVSMPILFSIWSCATRSVQTDYSVNCQNNFYQVNLLDSMKSLDEIADFYQRRCPEAVIQLGSQLRSLYYDKTYKVTTETAELFMPEGSQSPYTLESHERTYLTLLIAASYIQVEQMEKAEVELRKAYFESRSEIYNYGEDLVTVVIQATLWEKINRLDFAEPLWRRALELGGQQSLARDFIENRLQNLEKSTRVQPLLVYGYDRFPDVRWDFHFHKSSTGYYQLSAVGGFPEICSDTETLVVPTEAWFNKLQSRYSSNYHPLLNLKSWVRLPVGAAYGLGVGMLGVGVGFGGCAGLAAIADGKGGEAAAELCGYALQAASEVTSLAPKVVDYTLKPDLRHWSNVPRAFVISTAGSYSRREKCGGDIMSKVSEVSKIF